MNLGSYILRRFLSAIPLFILLPFITFFLMYLIPGDYFDSLRLNPQISTATIEQYEKLYHLDQPFTIQYFYWLKNLFRFDFGYSFAYKQPVFKILASRLWNTFLLTSTSFFLAWLGAIFFGLLAGLHPGGLGDRILNLVAYVGLSIPNFFLCILLLWVALHFGHLPLGGMRSVVYDTLPWHAKLFDLARHMVIPVAVLSFSSFAYLFRLMRAQTIEVAQKDFVLHLRAQRVSSAKIVFKHVARNAINPMVSLFGLELPSLFSGAALVEIFTGWPGLGQMMLQAVRTQDIFLVLGNIVMVTFLLIAGNLLADFLLAVVDPRIRFENS